MASMTGISFALKKLDSTMSNCFYGVNTMHVIPSPQKNESLYNVRDSNSHHMKRRPFRQPRVVAAHLTGIPAFADLPDPGPPPPPPQARRSTRPPPEPPPLSPDKRGARLTTTTTATTSTSTTSKFRSLTDSTTKACLRLSNSICYVSEQNSDAVIDRGWTRRHSGTKLNHSKTVR